MKPVLTFSLLVAMSQFSNGAAVLNSVIGSPAPNNTTGLSVAFPKGANTDWGYFQLSGTPATAVTTLNATNSSNIAGGRTFAISTYFSNGTSSISNPAAISLRGPGNITTGAPFSYFDFDNGESPVSANDSRPTGMFNNQLGAGGVTAGAGIQMSLTGFTTQSQIQIWTYGFETTGLFEVLLNGTSTFSESVVTSLDSNGKFARLFTIDFTPEAETDTLLLRYSLTAQNNASAHLGFQAVSIMPIPEVTSTVLFGFGAVAGLLRRRR